MHSFRKMPTADYALMKLFSILQTRLQAGSVVPMVKALACKCLACQARQSRCRM